jgi:acyl dehydratase
VSRCQGQGEGEHPGANPTGQSDHLDSPAVTVNSHTIGKRYEPLIYAVGREKIVEYALATGETNPLHLDLAAARAAGHADVVAPPMFAVVYQGRSVTQAMFDPELGIDFARLVHGEQAFRWHRLVVAGDEVFTTLTVADISEKMEIQFYAFATESVNQRGETVCTGTWTNIVRPPQ